MARGAKGEGRGAGGSEGQARQDQLPLAEQDLGRSKGGEANRQLSEPHPPPCMMLLELWGKLPAWAGV